MTKLTYAEQLNTDPELRAFRDAEVAKAVVELAALRAEHERQASTIRAQAQTIADLQRDLKALGTSGSNAQPKKARLRENAR